MQYTLVRSKRRRRSAAMRVTPQGEIVVRAPQYMPKFMIDRFVSTHTGWIAKQRDKLTKPVFPKRRYHTRTQLEDLVQSLVKQYGHLTGLSPSSLRFRQVKSYWGSCSPAGVLSFNLQLVFVPPQAVEYVVVHELCHLRHRGHGKRFWDLVYNLYPPANDMRTLLRQISREYSRNS